MERGLDRAGDRDIRPRKPDPWKSLTTQLTLPGGHLFPENKICRILCVSEMTPRCMPQRALVLARPGARQSRGLTRSYLRRVEARGPGIARASNSAMQVPVNMRLTLFFLVHVSHA